MSKRAKLLKSELISKLSDKTDFHKKAIMELFEALAELVKEEILAGKDVVLPGLVKISIKDKAATKERSGINPFNKQPMVIQAKPASKRVHVCAVRAFKEEVVPK